MTTDQQTPAREDQDATPMIVSAMDFTTTALRSFLRLTLTLGVAMLVFATVYLGGMELVDAVRERWEIGLCG